MKELANIVEELQPLQNINLGALSNIGDSVLELKRGQKLIHNELQQTPNYPPSESGFISVLEAFATDIDVKIQFIEKEYLTLKQLMEEVLVYFGETDLASKNALKPDELGSILTKFLKEFEV